MPKRDVEILYLSTTWPSCTTASVWSRTEIKISGPKSIACAAKPSSNHEASAENVRFMRRGFYHSAPSMQQVKCDRFVTNQADHRCGMAERSCWACSRSEGLELVL